MNATRFLATTALCVLWGFGSVALADGLSARTDVAKVAEGTTFQLILGGDAGQLTAEPDLTPLARDFDVLDTAQSRQTRIINGARSDTLQWTVTLQPRSMGALTIPQITAGAATSDPITVEVVDAASMPVITVPGAPEIAVIVPEGTHYVQQEIPVILRITAGPNLQSAGVVLPQSPDFTLTQSGEDRVSHMAGQTGPVTVTERTYMLRPQKDGQITLPPLTLDATISDPNARSPFANSPFQEMFARGPFGQGGNDPFAAMFNTGKRVAVRSSPITRSVKADPAGGNT
jgi:hypothetical protein